MTNLAVTDDLFFARTGMDPDRVEALVGEQLAGMDDGELFLEYSQSESVALDDGRIRSASFDTTQGFGLRAVAGEAAGYAHASEISEAAIRRAGATVRAVASGYNGTMAEPPHGTNRALYTDLNPLGAVDLSAKTKLLTDIDAYARGLDPRVRQVMASISGVWQAVQIVRADGQPGRRHPPAGAGQRLDHGAATATAWRPAPTAAAGASPTSAISIRRSGSTQVDEALRQALVNLGSVPAPAGEMTVVLGPGWPGVMLHEAVGHGLEGDFNRKKTSAFAGLMGERIASKGVTVVDDGTMQDRRGSLTVDDEGTPSAYNVLIEDGILKGYMHDRMNARLMGVAPTGNGRRESFAHAPIPRMTNTYMLAGGHDPQEIIGSVKKGLYAVNFGGGSVDITSGKFVFSASEAYLIEDGKIGAAVKGATLIGNGPDALTKISDDRQRSEARRRGRHLRQGRPGRAGRRRPADRAHGRPHRRRHRGLSLQPIVISDYWPSVLRDSRFAASSG